MDFRSLAHRLSGLWIILQHCLARRAWFMSLVSLKPTPPLLFFLVIISQASSEPFFYLHPFPTKSFWPASCILRGNQRVTWRHSWHTEGWLGQPPWSGFLSHPWNRTFRPNCLLFFIGVLLQAGIYLFSFFLPELEVFFEGGPFHSENLYHVFLVLVFAVATKENRTFAGAKELSRATFKSWDQILHRDGLLTIWLKEHDVVIRKHQVGDARWRFADFKIP